MASDKEARIVAAGDAIEVKGETYTLRPVVAQHLCDLERAALKYYKRSVLQTYTDNIDLLGNGQSQEVIEKKFDEVAGWDISSLPQKPAYDAERVPVTKALKSWIREQFGEVPETNRAIRALLVFALDSGTITPKEVVDLCGKGPIKGSVRYDQWWVTGTIEGMISFIGSSVDRSHGNVNIREWPFPKLSEAARIVESITSAAVGNG